MVPVRPCPPPVAFPTQSLTMPPCFSHLLVDEPNPMTFFITQGGQQSGPFDEEYVRERLRSGLYSPEDLAWSEGMAEWVSLRSLFPVDIPAATAASPPPLPSRKGQTPIHLEDSAGIRMLLPVGRSGWAIAAGYLGLFSMVIVPAPLALIASIIAIIDIRRSRKTDHVKYGMGRAIFGLVMGLLGTTILILIAIESVID